ncbi:DUF6069 family protein [Glycomyces buryatensis]|uniref:MFS transporter n=1 Tax=Glycomyces buryatensis TaxID=2570927 RepID=A0A4S8PUT6_9ACTN|nr:DUF6069 family protein [Glycomyces buryatensis]THV33665.1 hypothetical protein FAB82_26390 [Glycomyces buryatensis]
MEEETRSESVQGASVWRPRLIALLAATAANVIVVAIAAMAGVEMVTEAPGQAEMTVTVWGAIFATLVAGGAGWIVRALLDRFARRRAAWIWLTGASIIFLLELFPPLMAEASTGTTVTLLVMHAVVVAILFPVFGKRRPVPEV